MVLYVMILVLAVLIFLCLPISNPKVRKQKRQSRVQFETTLQLSRN
jgi:hypothetical protein